MQNTDLTKKNQNIIKHKNLLSHIKIGKGVLALGDIEIEKDKFYHHKSSVFKNYLRIEEVLLSKKISSGEEILAVLYSLLV